MTDLAQHTKKLRPVLGRTAPVWGLPASLPERPHVEIRVDPTVAQSVLVERVVPGARRVHQCVLQLAEKAHLLTR
jgi:hypothetical protein